MNSKQKCQKLHFTPIVKFSDVADTAEGSDVEDHSSDQDDQVEVVTGDDSLNPL